MAKVLILVNHEVVLFNFRIELVERLIKDGHKVAVSMPDNKRVEELKTMGCEHYDVDINRHSTNIFSEIKLIKYYKDLLDKVKPDIVFSYTIKPNIYGAIACRSKNIPIIANITGLGTAVENKGPKQFITIRLYKYAFKGIYKVFFQNTENRDFFIKNKIVKVNYDVLPGSGVNLEKFKLLPYPNHNHTEFAFISRIMKEKGIGQYLEAAKLVKEKFPDTKFHVCGFCEENYENTLNKYQENGTIIYHGMINNVSEFLTNIDCVVHPTYYPEGMSNVLLEACASGRPIITTNRSGCREIVDDNINGYIVKERDSLDLFEKEMDIISLEKPRQQAMGLEGRKHVENNFSRDIIINKYLETFKEL